MYVRAFCYFFLRTASGFDAPIETENAPVRGGILKTQTNAEPIFGIPTGETPVEKKQPKHRRFSHNRRPMVSAWSLEANGWLVFGSVNARTSIYAEYPVMLPETDKNPRKASPGTMLRSKKIWDMHPVHSVSNSNTATLKSGDVGL